MSTIDALLDAAKAATGASNDSELAARLGVRPSSVSNYRKGVSLPNAVVCATLAGLTGEPLVKVIGIVGEARAISREEKAVWRKLAGMAMALCLAVGFALPHKAQAADASFDKPTVYTLCEMASGASVSAGPPSSAPRGNGWASGSALACDPVPRPRMRSRHD
ncbi:hypothetical protein JY404_01470 [Stenotrophomonas maltophilia]|nr:hypothetical protein [Stenotrophomonas maltophilia]